jgi:hypothetical protein
MTNTKQNDSTQKSGVRTQKTKRERLWKLSPEAPCLLDIEVYRFWNLPRTKLLIRPKTVRVYTHGMGYSLIRVFKILVPTEEGRRHVYADVVTGTLYEEDGTCLSSANRRITNWRIR